MEQLLVSLTEEAPMSQLDVVSLRSWAGQIAQIHIHDHLRVPEGSAHRTIGTMLQAPLSQASLEGLSDADALARFKEGHHFEGCRNLYFALRPPEFEYDESHNPRFRWFFSDYLGPRLGDTDYEPRIRLKAYALIDNAYISMSRGYDDTFWRPRIGALQAVHWIPDHEVGYEAFLASERSFYMMNGWSRFWTNQHQFVVDRLTERAHQLQTEGNHRGAETVARLVLRLQQRYVSQWDSDVITAKKELAIVLIRTGDPDRLPEARMILRDLNNVPFLYRSRRFAHEVAELLSEVSA